VLINWRFLQATYYGAGGDSAGTCSFWVSGADNLPWATGNSDLNTGIFAGQAIRLAINHKQFAEGYNGGFSKSASCGMCIRYRGTNKGLGNKDWDPPRAWNYAIINNMCADGTCVRCDIDTPRPGDGRWKVQWYVLPSALAAVVFHPPALDLDHQACL
jgi:hypothetical protein